MIDVQHEVNAVERKVGRRTLAAGEGHTVTLARTYPTSAADLWEAVTTPERIARWFAPVTGELKQGGHYQVQGNASGTIETCDAPRSFTATWEFGGGVSWIEVSVEPAGDDEARLRLVHIAEHMDHWTQFGPAAVGIGWDLGLLGLSLHLADPSAPKIDEAEFGASAEGLAFMQGSGESWYEADVAGGEDAADARTRADATIGFYTTPPSEG